MASPGSFLLSLLFFYIIASIILLKPTLFFPHYILATLSSILVFLHNSLTLKTHAFLSTSGTSLKCHLWRINYSDCSSKADNAFPHLVSVPVCDLSSQQDNKPHKGKNSDYHSSHCVHNLVHRSFISICLSTPSISAGLQTKGNLEISTNILSVFTLWYIYCLLI